VNGEGEHIGYVKDFLGLIGKYSDLKFQPEVDNWNNLVEKARAKKLDMLPLIIVNDERKQFLSFTESYVQALIYFFVHDDFHPKSLEDLNGKTLAIPKGYGQIAEVKQKFPKLKIMETANLMDAIKAVLERKADVLLESYSV
jgi:two-component system, NarL family, sensor histidine kinase EvgS